MTQANPLARNVLDVLVVEADPVLAQSLVLLFATAQLHAAVQTDAKLVAQHLKQASPGCLVIDEDLVGDSGVALLGRLRLEGYRTPAIILANQGDVRLAVTAIRAGAADFLEKPLADARLLQRVRDILRATGKPMQASAS